MKHEIVDLGGGMAKCVCGAGPGPRTSIEAHVERKRNGK